MKMERSVEFIPPILMSKYSGSSGPTDDKIDRISSLCAWLSGWLEIDVLITDILTGALHISEQRVSAPSA